MAGPFESPTPEPVQAPAESRPKVIYVMGQGKSGSTILGVALGNCDGVCFAGELVSWLMTSGKPIRGGTERAEFWRGVSEDIPDAAGLFGSAAFHDLERGLAAIRIDRRGARRSLRKRYGPVTEALYRSIANRARASHVVDTSHLPLRARELQQLEGIDLYLVFLVRNIESVVASHTRYVRRREVAERRLRFAKVNAHLWVTYLLSTFVFIRQPPDRRLLVRHEDFLANPAGILREILDFTGSSAPIPDLSALRTGIAFQGNAILRSEEVALEPQPAAAHRPSRLLRLMDRPWALVLGRLQPAATGRRAGELS